jgi:hypothetical protein
MQERKLKDLFSVGPATLEDFRRLGVGSVAQLARSEPVELYERLCAIRKTRIDPCQLDVFTAAVAQARNPHLPAEKRKWWYWSQVRKRATAKG